MAVPADEDLRNKTLALARMQEEEEENEATVHAAPMLPARARPTWLVEGLGLLFSL